MTLVLALNCADGLLLVSDSQATVATSGQHLKATLDKIFAPWDTVAWGASGHLGIIQAVQDVIKQRAMPSGYTKSSVSMVKDSVMKIVVETVKPLLLNVVNVPGEMAPNTAFMFAGYASGEPFIFEIAPNLVCTNFIDKGYHAIGSGDIFPFFALASLAHFNIQGRNLREAKLIAHRVMDDALRVAAFGIGPPIQMIEISKPGLGSGGATRGRKVSDDELSQLAAAVTEWKALEAETLSTALGLSPREEALGSAG